MIKFIPKDIVLYFHNELIRIYGGSYGIRDNSLLESALAQPEATFNGEYLHKSIFEMAGAYCFHLCKNHPFVDGNKRIAFTVMHTFLNMNGFNLNVDEFEAYQAIIKLTESKISKEDISKWIEKNSEKK